MVQIGHDQLMGILLIDCWWSKWESVSSTFWFQLVGGSSSYGQYIQLTSPTWWGFQSLQKNSKMLLSISLEGEPGHCPKASLLFLLTVPLLTLHPLPSLISNCLNLLIGIQGKVKEVDWSLFPVTKKWQTRKGFSAHKHHRTLVGFSVCV